MDIAEDVKGWWQRFIQFTDGPWRGVPMDFAQLATIWANKEPRLMTGFLATLTPEQRERALVPFDGDETLGEEPT